MKRTLVPVALGVVLLLAAASAVSAQPARKPAEKGAAASAAPAPGMAMNPPAEMDKVKWMVGTWQCSGKTMASSMGPEHPTEAQVNAELTLDGMWLLHHYREKKTAQNTMPISADEYWTYSTAEKMWDRVAVDNVGGWATGTAKGWEKGKLIWASDGMMGGQKMKFRDTFTEKSPHEINYVGEVGTADGKWTTVWDISCKK